MLDKIWTIVRRIGIGLTFVLLVGWLLVSTDVITSAQLFGALLIGVPLASAWVDNRVDVTKRSEAWGEAAELLGLSCRQIGRPFGSQMIVDGKLAARDVKLSVVHNGQSPTSRIEMSLDTTTPIILRIWGPTSGEEMETTLFKATNVRCFGRKSPFLVRSDPQPLATRLYTAPVWDKLLSFSHRTNIQIEGNKLSLEQAGVWQKPEAILAMVLMLQEMAEATETWEMGWRKWRGRG